MRFKKVNSLLIIVNKNIPHEAKQNLSAYGKLIEFYTEGIVDEYLSGHPDLFFTVVNNQLIYSPSVPIHIIQKLDTDKKKNCGFSHLMNKYPDCASYNAVVTKSLLIHKTEITDQAIKNACKEKSIINVNQGMTRCSLVALNDSAFITSDDGIFRTLKSENYKVLRVNSQGIILPGMPYGLFGGTCGLHDEKLFILGSLRYYHDGEIVRDFCNHNSVSIIELYEGPLFDGGSILFF